MRASFLPIVGARAGAQDAWEVSVVVTVMATVVVTAVSEYVTLPEVLELRAQN